MTLKNCAGGHAVLLSSSASAITWLRDDRILPACQQHALLWV